MQMRHIKLRRSLYYSLYTILSITTSVSGGIASSLDPSLGLKRSLRLARPWARTDRANRGYIITLSLASSGYKEQDRRPIWLTPAMGNDGAPRAP
jgi:hypothetical protein